MNENQTNFHSCGNTLFRWNEHAVIYNIAATNVASCGNTELHMRNCTKNRNSTCGVLRKFAVTCVINCTRLPLHIRHNAKICKWLYIVMANILTMHKVAVGDVTKAAKHQYPYSCLMLCNTIADA